jgi:lipoprotein-anchoring transpeptidase ErfK/SrfK
VAAAPAVDTTRASAPIESDRTPAVTPRPPVVPLTPPTPPLAEIWQGTAGGDAFVRSAPNRDAPVVDELRKGDPVIVKQWVAGEEVQTEMNTWADLGEGRYVFSALLRRAPLTAAPTPPADAPANGRWIDVNLTLQIATAYDGQTPVRSVLISPGRPGWDTPIGTFQIQRRVASETMDGRTLGDPRVTYRVEHVRWTQYFTSDGSALHENYWRSADQFGMPGSHGCIGMRSQDAAWFWTWAGVGTPLVIH